MKKIIYSSQYIIPEFISAHMLEPVRDFCHSSGNFEGEGEGVCPYAEMMYRNALLENVEAVVFTTRCDQMRRISELMKSSGKECFLMNVPSTWQAPVSLEIFKDELLRLSRFFSEISGKKFSLEILKNELMKKKEHLAESKDGTKIALMGGPMISSDAGLIKILEDNSANIALDATEQGELSQPDIDSDNLEKDPIAELANAYFADIPDIAKRPNTQFYDKAEIMIKERGIEAIIVRIYPWCDLWHAEVQRIKEYFDLPVLQITADINVAPLNDKRLQTRLNAFMEMI